MHDETNAEPNALRDEIRRLGPWHYDIEIAPGVRTGERVPPGTYPAELGTPAVFDPFLTMDSLADHVYGGDFAGRSILDCACNAGGYLFGAARRGASLRLDVRDHWIRQARFLQRHLHGDDIEFEVRNLGRIQILAARDEKTFAHYDALRGRRQPLLTRLIRRMLGQS